MKTIKFLLCAMIALALVGCGSKKKDLDKILSLEKEVFTDASGMNKAKAEELVKSYIAFADHYDKDSLAPACIYKAAEMSINLNKGDDAIAYFDRVIKDYPNYYKVAEAYFLKGFVYEIIHKNLKKARECYTAFLEKYPNHELSDDAKVSLDNLGKTPEQIIREAQEKLQQDSLAAK